MRAAIPLASLIRPSATRAKSCPPLTASLTYSDINPPRAVSGNPPFYIPFFA